MWSRGKERGTRVIACENISFSSLFAARNVPSGEERGETDVFAGYESQIPHRKSRSWSFLPSLSLYTNISNKPFSFIFILSLAPEEGLFSNRNIKQFVSFFCLFLQRLAVRISLPFHIFPQVFLCSETTR